jgi:hypothetical protein
LDESGKLISMSCLTCIETPQMIKNEENCFPVDIYQNDKITFNINEIDSTKTIGNCYDFGKAIFHGTYECISKPSNRFYVLNNVEGKNSVVKEKEADSDLVNLSSLVEEPSKEIDDNKKDEKDREDEKKKKEAIEYALKKENLIKQLEIKQGIKRGIKQGKEEGLKQGLRKGKEEGLKQGKEEGLKQGKEEGLKQGKEEMARILLQSGVDINIISQSSGLTIDEIQKLRHS